MVENNKVMLDSIYKKVEEDEDIGLVVFLGDLQHTTPRDLKQTSEWRRWFVELNKLMIGRDYTDISLRYDEDKVHKNDIRVVSVRGNHDDEIFNQRKSGYTFFDELESEGLIANPKQIIYKDNGEAVVLDIRNYGEADRELSPEVQDKALTIALTHDNIMSNQSDEYVKLIVEESDGHYVEDIGAGCDFVINGHIHTKYAPQAVTVNSTGKPVIYYIVGSLARTSLSQGQMRDEGYGLMLDTSSEEVELEDVTFDLIPYTEYFDLKGYQHNQRVQQAQKDFSLGLDDQQVIHQEDLEQVIRESRQFENQAREKAIELLALVDADLEREAREERG